MEFRTEKEILLEMVEKAIDNGLLTDVMGNITSSIENGENTDNQYVLDLATHSYLLASLEDKTNTLYTNMDVATATGDGLDALGELVNVYRYTAQPSKIEVLINTKTSNNKTNYIIPAGTEVILDPIIADTTLVTYTTDEAVTISSGVNSGTVYASSSEVGSITRIPSGTVTGLNGFTSVFNCSNTESTGGRDIEEDDTYRERIKKWYLQNIIGTKECISNYLESLDTVEDYRLIPQWNGVGTLKIVLDCLEGKREEIRQGVQENCMLYTDDPVVCVNAEEEYIDSLDLVAFINGNLTYTTDELSNMIIGQCRVYLEGGTSRGGVKCKGLTIGQEFEPSKLVSFLLSEIPEVSNIRITSQDAEQKVIEVTQENCILKFNTITVAFEWGSSTESYYQTT